MKNLLLLLTLLITSIVKSQPCTVSLSILQNPSCSNCGDGILQANATGIPPFIYNWIPSISSQQTAINLIIGTYWVCIQDSTGCQVCDSITLNEAVDVQNITSESMILFSPNPFTSNLILRKKDKCLLTIFNAMGKKLFENEIERGNETINVAWLSAGMYFIQLQTESSNTITKVIKE